MIMANGVRPFLACVAVTATALLMLAGCAAPERLQISPRNGNEFVIVYQPSHQTDTGRDFNEALTCNAITEYAMAAASGVTVHKVWSYDATDVHHARQGSNTMIAHTSAVDSLGRISGYAYEIRASNAFRPDVFIAIHNNGATNRNGCWGYVHEGDSLEPANRRIAAALVKAVSEAGGLTDLGVHGDSEPNRNDYRCSSTGKLAFYSLDEHVNSAPYRVLLEIGDNELSRSILLDSTAQRRIGAAIEKTIEHLLPR